MKSFIFYLFLLKTCFLLPFEKFKKDYLYLSLATFPSFETFTMTSSLGAGYRIHLNNKIIFDGLDINMSYVHKTDNDNGFKQLVLPRILLIKNIFKSFYIAAGSCYIEAEKQKEISYYFNKYPLKIKRKLIYKDLATNFVLGYKIWETKESINFCQYELLVPTTFLLQNGKDVDFITMSFSVCVGF